MVWKLHGDNLLEKCLIESGEKAIDEEFREGEGGKKVLQPKSTELNSGKFHLLIVINCTSFSVKQVLSSWDAVHAERLFREKDSCFPIFL